MFTVFRLFVGAVFVLILLYKKYQYSWEPMFAFVFEAVLFVFAYASPAFALLFALPPKSTPEEQTTFYFLTQSNSVCRLPSSLPGAEMRCVS